MTAEPYYAADIRTAIDAGLRRATITGAGPAKVRADRIARLAQVPLSDGVTRTDVVVRAPVASMRFACGRTGAKASRATSPACSGCTGAAGCSGSRSSTTCASAGGALASMSSTSPCSTGWRPSTPYPAGLEDCYAGLAVPS